MVRNQYACRAECQLDLCKFLMAAHEYAAAKSKWISVTKMEPVLLHRESDVCPDCECSGHIVSDTEIELVTSMTLHELREIMGKVPDGHVMLGTLAPIEQYTGEREYGVESEYTQESKPAMSNKKQLESGWTTSYESPCHFEHVDRAEADHAFSESEELHVVEAIGWNFATESGKINYDKVHLNKFFAFSLNGAAALATTLNDHEVAQNVIAIRRATDVEEEAFFRAMDVLKRDQPSIGDEELNHAHRPLSAEASS